MRTKLGKLLSIITLLLLVITPAMASAHVLIPDTTNTSGAILHLTPNDEPLAGKPTSMLFDIQTKKELGQGTVLLEVADGTGGILEYPIVKIKGRTAAGSFIFPSRGLYFITLRVFKDNTQRGQPVTYKYALRIVKSAVKSDPSYQVPAWAMVGLIVSIWGLLAIAITFVRRRRIIMKGSF